MHYRHFMFLNVLSLTEILYIDTLTSFFILIILIEENYTRVIAEDLDKSRYIYQQS